MASVGSGGCGFEHPLEAVYRALHDCPSDANCTIPANLGFLRPDALLAVVWVTDEDDCSAPPDTDLFTQSAPYGFFASFRCTHYGIVCEQNGSLQLPPYGDSGGPLANCQGAPNPTGNSSGPPPAGQGKLFDVNRYIDFFKTIKPRPEDVLLAAIDAPSDPFQILVGDLNLIDQSRPGGYAACPSGTMVGTPPCEVLLGHSCNASTTWFGDPAVRINQVVRSAPNNNVASICDFNAYDDALGWLGDAIAARVMGAP
jgi:hypothetical protein